MPLVDGHFKHMRATSFAVLTLLELESRESSLLTISIIRQHYIANTPDSFLQKGVLHFINHCTVKSEAVNCFMSPVKCLNIYQAAVDGKSAVNCGKLVVSLKIAKNEVFLL